MNVQYAIKDGDIYVLEVNPRASRTVPFVAKVIGLPVAKIAARVMAGEKLASFDLKPPRFDAYRRQGSGVPVRPLPRRRHRARPGDEIDRRGDGHRPLVRRSPSPRASSAAARGCRAPGTVFVSVRDADKPRMLEAVRTSGRHWAFKRDRHLRHPALSWHEHGVQADRRSTRCSEGRPHIVDAIKNGEVQLVFNTTEGAQALADSRSLRRAALLHKVPYYTTLSGAVAAAQGIKAYLGGDLEVRALQSYFGGKG